MRSALICVFFALLVRRGSLADNDFRPMPIPLSEWHHDRRDSRAGTLHETIKTDAPPSVAAVPAHYWEDALRHSVYLTLVRDKIDQLIAKGEVISPDSKPDQFASKDIDDHDLWEKIKTAPFDRIQEEEPSSFGDVTVMAIGRLMEERNGFRFTEDDRSKEKCKDDKCMAGVKAFWSVKRVRQREVETSPGKYHYELTFSVSSQHPKKQKKPYENPVRTFTVRETTPDQALDMPQEHRAKEKLRILPPSHATRPTRAIWFHKNIVPNQGRQVQHGLDRIFSSFFSDDDDEYEPPRYRPQPPPPQYHQYAKMGYVSSPSDQQKRLTPYPYRQQTVYKYARPIGPPPPQYHQHPHHQFIGSVETDSAGHSYQDFRFGPPSKPIRTTRPAVLPTPLPPIPPTNRTEDSEKQTTQIVKQNVTEAPFIKTTDMKTIHKTVHKIRPGPLKINYLPDHVRPPIYNAPPGVFVTMDKKPFKPMPPLKFHGKPIKHKPVDFRPSPQVLDMQQFSEPDPQHDTAFRPITWNHYAEQSTTENTETTAEVVESSTQVNTTRKTTQKGKKPPKKHEIIQPSRTTSAPEIITASSDSGEESDAMQWANVVGAFSKTTPMASEKKSDAPESTTPTTTSTSTTTTTAATTTTVTAKRRTTTTTTTEAPETTTTRKPRTKRTRPPPKFTKPNTIKKHKRITTTTTKAPEVKTTQDLTPQASSLTASKPPKPTTTTTTAKPNTTTATSTTTTTTTRPTTTTTKATTTTTTTTSTTTQSPKPESKDAFSTTQPKIKNRFRQSTLMTKGTSVKHDKWTAPPTSPEKNKPTGPAATSKPVTGRRKGSNFHGYVSSTTPRTDKEYEKFHEDKGSSKTLSVKPLATTTQAATTTQSYEETVDQYENDGDFSDDAGKDNENFEDEPSGTDEQESRDHTEYIFQSTTPSERTNEVDAEPITTEQIITSPLSAPKNKTKCKKKKTQNTTTTEEAEESIVEQTTSTMSVVPITTTQASTPSIFEELFGSFTVDDSVQDSKSSATTTKADLQEQGSEKHGQFVKLDDDLQDFLDSLERDGRDVDVEQDYVEDEESEPSIDDVEEEYEEDEDSPAARDMPQGYERYETVDDYKRPYSLFELMAME